MSKVLVGMSGGIDSSMAAYLLQQKGYDVEGLSLIVCDTSAENQGSTCSAIEGAAVIARQLGIPHATADVRSLFLEKVIRPFVHAYRSGITPNPCVLCNRLVKYPVLLQHAKESGIEFVATGHYARISQEQHRRCTAGSPTHEFFTLKKGKDTKKDQSYVLHALQQESLPKILLPLGEARKVYIRQQGEKLALASAAMPESQEICFIKDRNYFQFVQAFLPETGKPVLL